MVSFWDTSAVVTLILQEAGTTALAGSAEESDMFVWWGTVVEAISAIARLERSGTLKRDQVEVCLSRLNELCASWAEVAPSDALRDLAGRKLRVHALKAADSLQLAAALTLAAGDPGALEFVCRDSRLAEAAAREGLRVRSA